MNIKELKSNEIMPGFHGRILHGSDFTWVYWEIDKGSSLPEHNHVNEQLMHVVKGKFEFTISYNNIIAMPDKETIVPYKI